MVVGELLSLAQNEPILAAILVIGYAQYTIKYGAVAAHFRVLEGIIAIQIALAEEVDGVDEDQVMDRFNGGDSNQYRDSGGDS